MNPENPSSQVKKTFFHEAFGLTWSMPFYCPELREAASDAKADVMVRFGIVPPAPANALAAGPLRQVTPGEVRTGFPGVARYLIRDGNEITIEKLSDDDDTIMRLTLIGTAAGLLMHQRGILPLHASGIVTSKGAVLFMGHSGSGKSTLVNAFMRRGFPMLCEDLAAIRLDPNGLPVVFPGVQVTKLWADSANMLGQDTEGLPRVREELQKFLVPVRGLATDPAPLFAVYALATHNEPAVTMEERLDSGKFNALLDHTWQKLVVKRMGLHVAHFQRAIAVGNRVRIVKIQRPSNRPSLDELTDRIEADFNR